MADLLVKEKPKRFLKIRNYFKLKKLEKLLREHTITFDKLDEENIEEVIRNPLYTEKESILNGFDNSITADEVVNTVIDFYYSISSEMGDAIKNLYNTYKDKIFIEQPKDEKGNLINTKSKASEGVTYNPIYPQKKIMKNGTEKDVVCNIDLCQNYTTYYTVTHEFMHLIQRSLGNEDEKLAEVNTRFVEYLLGEYLVEKGIITQENVNAHNLANNSQKNTAFKLKDILIITKLSKEHRLTQSRVLKEIGCTPERLSHRLDGIIESINGEEKDRPKNDLRFINGMVGANKLLDIYNEDKVIFKKAYGRIMSKKYQGKFDFDHFFEDIEKAIKSEKMNKTDRTGNSDLKKFLDNKTVSKIIDDDVFEK